MGVELTILLANVPVHLPAMRIIWGEGMGSEDPPSFLLHPQVGTKRRKRNKRRDPNFFTALGSYLNSRMLQYEFF